jgi:hypothetical protein
VDSRARIDKDGIWSIRSRWGTGWQAVPRPHRCLDDDIKSGEKYLVFLLPMNASSFLESHFLFHKNKLDVAL